MHAFQPMDLKYFENNPFKLIGKDWMAVTAKNEHDVNSMTASWGGFGVMWGKNTASIVIRQSRYTKEFIDSSETFSLSFFNPDDKKQREALAYLGAVSGRNVNKIKNAHLHINLHLDEKKNETPFIDEARLVLICKKMFAQELKRDGFLLPEIEEKWYKNGDYHTLYIGEITAMLAR